MINIVCVLKAGGDFNPIYVRNLYNACVRNSKSPFNFICLTDFNPKSVWPNDNVSNFGRLLEHFYVFYLKQEFKGFWSKFEIFKLKNRPYLYFDLDTVITGDISPLVEVVNGLESYEFIGLESFNPERRKIEEKMFASGVMGWRGDFHFIMKKFSYYDDSINPNYLGDQDRIYEILREYHVKVRFWQHELPENTIVSYKRHMAGNELLPGTKVVCFHGKPRPWNVRGINWMRKHWLGEESVNEGSCCNS